VSGGTWIAPLAGMGGTPAGYLSALRFFWTLGSDTIPWFADTRVLLTRDGDFSAAAAEAARSIVP